PFLLWYGLAQRMPRQMDSAFAIAERSRIPFLTDWVYWYAASFEGPGLNRVLGLLDKAQGEVLRRRLAGVELATTTRVNLTMPPAWKNLAPKLYASDDQRIQRAAERLAAAFGDASMF